MTALSLPPRVEFRPVIAPGVWKGLALSCGMGLLRDFQWSVDLGVGAAYVRMEIRLAGLPVGMPAAGVSVIGTHAAWAAWASQCEQLAAALRTFRATHSMGGPVTAVEITPDGAEAHLDPLPQDELYWFPHFVSANERR